MNEHAGSRRDPRRDGLDHRPDLWGRVEGPPDTPRHIIDQAIAVGCPDCQVNVFIEHEESDPTGYAFKIAHDETCPWLAAHEKEESMSTTPSPTPNSYCVILGTPGTDPLTIVGPFATEGEAGAHVAEHKQKNPQAAAMADVLLAPANCP